MTLDRLSTEQLIGRRVRTTKSLGANGNCPTGLDFVLDPGTEGWIVPRPRGAGGIFLDFQADDGRLACGCCRDAFELADSFTDSLLAAYRV